MNKITAGQPQAAKSKPWAGSWTSRAVQQHFEKKSPNPVRARWKSFDNLKPGAEHQLKGSNRCWGAVALGAGSRMEIGCVASDICCPISASEAKKKKKIMTPVCQVCVCVGGGIIGNFSQVFWLRSPWLSREPRSKRDHTPSLTFWHLPPRSATILHARKGCSLSLCSCPPMLSAPSGEKGVSTPKTVKAIQS